MDTVGSVFFAQHLYRLFFLFDLMLDVIPVFAICSRMGYNHIPRQISTQYSLLYTWDNFSRGNLHVGIMQHGDCPPFG